MKNTIKVIGTHSRMCAIALIAVLGLSLTGCDTNPGSGGGGSGGSGDMKPRLMKFQTSGDMQNIFLYFPYQYIIPGGSYDVTTFADDFAVTIDGTPVNISSVHFSACLYLFVNEGPPYYTPNTAYTIEVKYTADPAHPIRWGKEDNNYPYVLGDFTYKATVTSQTQAG